MWLPNWLYDAYLCLFRRHGTKESFTSEDAREELGYSKAATWKVLNELEKAGIITKTRSKKNYKKKLYRLLLKLEEVPFHKLEIPTDKLPEIRMLLDYMPSTHYCIKTGEPQKEYYRRLSESGKFLVTIEKGRKQTEEDKLVDAVNRYNTEFVSKALQQLRANWQPVLHRLSSFKKRYVGAIIDVLLARGVKNEQLERLRDEIYKQTKRDNRYFSIYPKTYRKQPKEFRNIGKKWRINLNISKEEVVGYE